MFSGLRMAIHNPQQGQIPVIDISGSTPDDEIAEQLVKAASTYGFVYIKNEGEDISIKVIDEMFDIVWQSSQIMFWHVKLTLIK